MKVTAKDVQEKLDEAYKVTLIVSDKSIASIAKAIIASIDEDLEDGLIPDKEGEKFKKQITKAGKNLEKIMDIAVEVDLEIEDFVFGIKGMKEEERQAVILLYNKKV